MRRAREHLFVLVQHVLPQHLFSHAAGALANCRVPVVKNLLITRFIDAFDVDMRDAAEPDPLAYADFNAFFTRSLAPAARPIAAEAAAVVSPADGSVSEIGHISAGRILQAKRHGTAQPNCSVTRTTRGYFADGAFATIYLSPRDYHRVHMPLGARLRCMRYVPGRLFSVNRATAAAVPRLFARNERLVCLFESEHGPFALVMVGAMIVAGIETIWTGQIAATGRRPLLIDPAIDSSRRRATRAAR